MKRRASNSSWTVKMIACGHAFAVKTPPVTTHQEQKIYCKEEDCGMLGYWRFQ